MGLASYDVTGSKNSWIILHDGTPEGDFKTAEAAFEAAVAAASLALREGHEIRVTVKDQAAVGRDFRTMIRPPKPT